MRATREFSSLDVQIEQQPDRRFLPMRAVVQRRLNTSRQSCECHEPQHAQPQHFVALLTSQE
jgi:hypothetical protein